MTRIVGGVAGGRRIVVPDGRGTRPTSERAREGLFSSLGGELTGRSFLDLYAGSGAVGLEAASRGAAPVVLVEKSPVAARVVTANVQALGLPGVEVRRADAARLVASPSEASYDVVFLDPPYAEPVAAVLAALVDNGWLAPGAVVVVERATRSGELSWPPGVRADRSRRYGDSTLWYGRRP